MNVLAVNFVLVPSVSVTMILFLLIVIDLTKKMEEFRRLKFAFNYCNKQRKVEEPEQFYWAVKSFKKLNRVSNNTQVVKDF